MQHEFTAPPALISLGQLDGGGRHLRLLRSFPLCNQPGDTPLLAVRQRSERLHFVGGSHRPSTGSAKGKRPPAKLGADESSRCVVVLKPFFRRERETGAVLREIRESFV